MVVCEVEPFPHEECVVECQFCGEPARGAEDVILVGPDICCLRCGDSLLNNWGMLQAAGMRIFKTCAHNAFRSQI